MKLLFGVCVLAISVCIFGYCAATLPEAPTGFDNKANGMVDDATHAVDQGKFDEIEQVSDGLGPLYNAQSCRECHQNPTEVIKGRSLVNDRAICPNAAFPAAEIQERVPDSEHIRTFRITTNVLGDGFVEAVADQAFVDLAKEQCNKSHHKICGQVLYVPVVEAPGQTAVGRFGWKDQQASLLSFSADAYLNEMGITSRLQPDEVTNICNTVTEPNDQPGSDGLSDIDHFARFLRASKAPARDAQLAATPKAKQGAPLFAKIGCGECHVETMTTAAAGTKVIGDALTVPSAMGGMQFHPYGDFLLHDVGTGDGIVQSMTEHYGKKMYSITWKNLSLQEFGDTANKFRTPPLWGVRFRSRLMHDGTTVTLLDAILRHKGEAEHVTDKFEKLKSSEKDALLEFLRSL
jgi:CxxC motif-containing protein (DUF1111 family)